MISVAKWNIFWSKDTDTSPVGPPDPKPSAFKYNELPKIFVSPLVSKGLPCSKIKQ